MRATIGDIATSAGLSTATVDRVLNNRSGVSAASRHKVMEAAEELGYLPTKNSVVMPSKPVHLEFLIPVGANSFLNDLTWHLEDFAERLPLVASCTVWRLQGISPEEMVLAAERLSLHTSGVGVVAVDHPQTRNVLSALTETGVRVVTIASDIAAAARSAYIGIDNRVAGRTASLVMGRMIGAKRGTVAIFLGSRSYRGHEEREMGFRSVLNEEFPNLQASLPVEIQEDPEQSYAALKALLAEEHNPLGIYCVGGGYSGLIRALEETTPNPKPCFVCHEITRESRASLLSGIADVVIDQNARLTAEQSIIGLLGSIATSVPHLTRKFIEPRVIFRENIPAV